MQDQQGAEPMSDRRSDNRSDHLADDIVDNLSRPAHWIRIAYMVALLVAAYIASIVIAVVVLAQALFTLLTGNANPNLRSFGSSMGIYVKQILDFLTYNTEEKPFPFAPFPEPQITHYRRDDDDDIEEVLDMDMRDPDSPDHRP